MRRGIVIGGIVLVIIGLLAVGGGYAIGSASTTVTTPAGSVETLTPSTIGGGSISVSWTGAAAGDTIYLMSGTATCSGPSGVVAKGTGASGSFSASLSSGTTYSLYACSGASPAGATFTYSFSGISTLMLIGIVLAVVGALLLVAGFVAKPKMGNGKMPAAPAQAQ